MKRNGTLILLLSIAMMHFANATPILNKGMPKAANRNYFFSNKRVSGNPYQDNVMQFVLISKASTDTVYTYNGVACKVVFDSTFSGKGDNPGNQLDFNYGFGIGEDLSIIANGSHWGIHCWNLPTPKDTIGLTLVRVQPATNYQLIIDASIYKAPGMISYIYDNYLKTLKLIDSKTTFISFTPNPDSAATYQNRFSVVFKSSTLPIKNLLLNTALKNGNVYLSWNTTCESNIASFSIEKSKDGAHYNSINTTAAKNTITATYAYTDNSVSMGTVYYRIKATSKTGTVAYSAVSVITNTISKGGFSVYPNPVRNNVINLKVTNIATGNYTLNVYTILGERVSSQQLQHCGGTATYNLNMDKRLADGLYKLKIVSPTDKSVVYETSLLIKK